MTLKELRCKMKKAHVIKKVKVLRDYKRRCQDSRHLYEVIDGFYLPKRVFDKLSYFPGNTVVSFKTPEFSGWRELQSPYLVPDSAHNLNNLDLVLSLSTKKSTAVYRLHMIPSRACDVLCEKTK